MTVLTIINRQKIEYAILNNQILKFDYVAKDLSVTKNRIFEPVDIKQTVDPKTHEIKKTVIGNDLEIDDIRQFSLEGIQNLQTMSYGELMTFFCEGGEKENEEKISTEIKPDDDLPF